MATIKLTKVNIGLSKNVITVKNAQGVTTQAEMVVDMEGNIIVPEGSTLISSATKISFSTLSGNLEDNQYATQPNGFHWVKLPGYKMYKIDPEFISKNILSQEGIDFIYTNSVAE